MNTMLLCVMGLAVLCICAVCALILTVFVVKEYYNRHPRNW